MNRSVTLRAAAVLFLVAWLNLGCVGCNDDPPSADSDTDTDTDTDADTDSDTSTYTEVDFGDPIPCENEPLPGEVCVPGGKYVMGCVPGDDECEDNEKPMVEVMLSPFFVDIMEASNEEVIVFLNTLREGYLRNQSSVSDGKHFIWKTWENGTPIQLNKIDEYEWIDSSEAGSDFPFCLQRTVNSSAGGLSWYGAKLYCEWKGMQLPTEARWEAAARGQTLNEYPCGSNLPICAYGFYDRCTENDPCFDWACYECCIPFEEVSNCDSPYGVKNQLGNANEWVLDWRSYSSDHSWCVDGCTDPEPTTGERPIMKGGGVGNKYADTRISARKVIDGPDGNHFTGVRCVRPDVPVEESDAGADSWKK